MRVESVAWVTERKDVLCALFYLLACYQWIVYRQQTQWRAFVLAHVFCLFSLLAKPMAISLPFVFLSIDWLLGRTINRAALKDKVGIFILCVGLGWVTYQYHVRNPIEGPFKAVQLWVSSLVFYWKQFFLPINLNPIYPILKANQLLMNFLISMGFLIVLTRITLRHRANRLWVFALLFYISTIFFLLRFDDRSDIHWVADRFMYIPSVGICLWLGAWFNEHRRIGVMVLIVLAVLTVQLIPVWKDSVSLWSYVIKRSPNELLAYHNRADAYIDLKQPEQAVADYTRVIDLLKELPPKKIISHLSDGHGGEQVIIKPWHLNATEVKFNRALAYASAKRFDEAIADFDEVVQMYPQFEKALLQRGLVYEGKGDIKTATDDYGRCLSINPSFSECFFARGNLYNKTGQWYEALADYNQAIKLNPAASRLYGNRAIVYLALGLEEKALTDLNQAITMESQNGEFYFNRSVYYYEHKQYQLALADMLQASRLGVIIPDKYFLLVKQFSGVQ
jgi:tetratricopeptide (TPR) repeat protein